jgi:type IV secretory pathway VirB10-like protein
MSNPVRVVPAALSFLAIYNPALGDSDETFHKQIVFYYAKAAKARAKLGNDDAKDEQLREEENEKLRQVGLAQGMVGFARSFSRGESVDSIETEKSRIVLHELEHGWWILAVRRPSHRHFLPANRDSPSTSPSCPPQPPPKTPKTPPRPSSTPAAKSAPPRCSSSSSSAPTASSRCTMAGRSSSCSRSTAATSSATSSTHTGPASAPTGTFCCMAAPPWTCSTA